MYSVNFSSSIWIEQLCLKCDWLLMVSHNKYCFNYNTFLLIINDDTYQNIDAVTLNSSQYLLQKCLYALSHIRLLISKQFDQSHLNLPYKFSNMSLYGCSWRCTCFSIFVESNGWYKQLKMKPNDWSEWHFYINFPVFQPFDCIAFKWINYQK